MDESIDQIDRLTDGQRDCLRLIFARLEIKEIARELGIAPATVNQRLTAARKTLGVSRSLDAARLLAVHERADVYTSPLYTPNSMGTPPISADIPVPEEPSETDRPAPRSRGGIQWPFATTDRPSNTMSIGQRAAWAAVIAAGSMIAFAVMISALDTVSRLF